MLPGGDVLIHITAPALPSDKDVGAVLGIHDLHPGVVPGGRVGSDPLVDIPGSALHNVPSPGVLPTHAGQPTDVCGGVPGSLGELDLMVE